MAKKVDMTALVLAAVGKRAAKGLTSAEAAATLQIPERTARRHLALLFTAGRLKRAGEYVADGKKIEDAAGALVGRQILFYYRYTVKRR